MRVITGKYKNRNLSAPRGPRTHPMSERARSALFAMLGDIDGLTVLDGFGGSGAVGIEAASRGAKFVQIVEMDRKAYEVIVDNLEALSVEESEIKVARANVSSWVKNNIDTLFDLVVADPPYDNIDRTVLDILASVVDVGGTFVLSYPGSDEPFKFDDLKLVSTKNYATAVICIYKKK